MSDPILRGHPEIRLERYFTDGQRLVRVRSISPLGSVEFTDEKTGATHDWGCCAFERVFSPVEGVGRRCAVCGISLDSPNVREGCSGTDPGHVWEIGVGRA